MRPIENRISSGRGLHVRATLLSRRHPPPPPIMTPFDQRILRDRGRLTCRHGFTMAASPLPFLEMVSVVPLVVWPNSPVCTYAKSVPNRDLFMGKVSGQPCPEGPPLARPPEAVGATHHSEQSNAWSVSSSHACCGEYHNQPALSVSCPERHHAPELRSRELPASVKTSSGGTPSGCTHAATTPLRHTPAGSLLLPSPPRPHVKSPPQCTQAGQRRDSEGRRPVCGCRLTLYV
jgi:hypothetical protein